MRNATKLLIFTLLITPLLLGMERVDQDDQHETVAIKSIVTGGYIAINRKGYKVYRTGTKIEPWHKFKLIKLGNRNRDALTTPVALKSVFSNKYVGIESVENPVIVAKSTVIGENEKFVMYDLGEGRISLFSAAINKFVRIYEGKNRDLIADSNQTDEREAFWIETLGRPTVDPGAEGESVELSDEDEYGIDEKIGHRVDPEGDDMDSAEAPIAVPQEAYVVDLGSESENTAIPEKIALQFIASNKYVRGGVGSKTRLAAVSDRVRGWQAFKVIKKGEPYTEGLFTVQNVVLQSTLNCLYVRPVSEDGDILAAVSSADGERETFKMITVHISDKHFVFQSLQNSKYVQVVGKGKYLKTVSREISPLAEKEKLK